MILTCLASTDSASDLLGGVRVAKAFAISVGVMEEK